MDNVLPRTLLAIALGGLAASCSGGLFVGEKNCVGEGIDCDSDAPTLEIIDMLINNPVRGSDFEVAASRMVAPSWVYDDPKSRWAQLAPAPGGGVWVLYGDSPSELQRINAEGTPVESHSVDALGTLSSDEALRPVVLSSRGGWATRTTLDPSGEVFAWAIGAVAPEQSWPILVDGPEGRTRVAIFDERGSHVAEYTGTGDLVWKQLQVRNARHFPFEDLASVSYRMIGLSDGSIALGVPKDARSDRRPGLSGPEQVQGITLIEPDGNLRWDMVLDEASITMFLAPGLDGSVVYANTLRDGSNLLNIPGVMYVRLIDREGKLAATWSGQRTGYHEAVPSALCTDAAGQIYVAALSGERDPPVPTVCRMNPDDPGDVVCLGAADVVRPTNAEVWRRSGLSRPRITAISAPEPDAVVLAVYQGGYEIPSETGVESAEPVSRLVRIDF